MKLLTRDIFNPIFDLYDSLFFLMVFGSFPLEEPLGFVDTQYSTAYVSAAVTATCYRLSTRPIRD